MEKSRLFPVLFCQFNDPAELFANFSIMLSMMWEQAFAAILDACIRIGEIAAAFVP